ncbi:hypothetical protein THIX_90079 [Thiomonas sp. X19]|nr:hypothetical protein THIX_90079 [Thiomonas sp. X19]
MVAGVSLGLWAECMRVCRPGSNNETLLQQPAAFLPSHACDGERLAGSDSGPIALPGVTRGQRPRIQPCLLHPTPICTAIRPCRTERLHLLHWPTARMAMACSSGH